MEESIDTIISKVRETEELMEKRRKHLLSIEKETRRIKQDTELLSMKTKELKSGENGLLNEISQKKCELEMLQQKESLLKEMCAEKEKIFQKEESSLDEMQRAVWEHREKFCENVKEFSKRSWLSALTNIHSSSQPLIIKTYLQSLTDNTSEDSSDIQELEKTVQDLEQELKSTDEKLKEFSTVLLTEERENLLKEPSNSLLFRELKSNLKKELDLLQRLKFECKCAAEQITYNDMMIKRISHSTKDETPAPVKRFSCATLDKWIQRSVKRKGGSLSHGKENSVPYNVQPKENEFRRSDGEFVNQVENESLPSTAPHKPFIPKVPSSVLSPRSSKQTAASPEGSKITQSHNHIYDGSHKESESNLEHEVESESFPATAPHKPFTPKVPSGVVPQLSRKQNSASPERSKITQSHNNINDGSHKKSENNLKHEVENESLSATAPHQTFTPKVPSGVLPQFSRKQNSTSPERSEITQSHNHINDGSHKESEGSLEQEGEKDSFLLAGNQKQFVPKIPSSLVLNQSKKQNTSNFYFH